jgi:methylmalonyl-CoA mutase
MGSLREYKARADFSRGFLAVAGFDVVYPEGFKSPEAAAGAFEKSGAGVAVICSVDDHYPALVPPLIQAIRACRPDATIVLAGYPQEQVETHKKSGVDEFLHIRADAFELLAKLQSRLGIE